MKTFQEVLHHYYYLLWQLLQLAVEHIISAISVFVSIQRTPLSSLPDLKLKEDRSAQFTTQVSKDITPTRRSQQNSSSKNSTRQVQSGSFTF